MENCPCIYSMKIWIVKDIFNILEDSLLKLNEILREKIYMQMDNARIHWTLDALRFTKKTTF